MLKSLWNVFRINFVFSSLYLLGDAFYRWDGFSYYGSFVDFLPSISLVTVLVTLIVCSAILLIWAGMCVVRWLASLSGWKIGYELFPIFTLSLFIIVPYLLWFYQYEINRITQFSMKLLLLFAIIMVSMIIAWLLRKKADVIQDRITPLVWLFGLWFIVSVLIVSYHSALKGEDTGKTINHSLSASSKLKQPNILLVTFDALRAESMSVYGYQKDTTPFIRKWAEKATVFERAEAEGNYTFPTTISMMTGQRLWTHQNYHSHGYVSDTGRKNLPGLLQQNGYHTMLYSANKIVSAASLGMSDSFAVAPGISEFYSTRTMRGAIDRKLCQLFCDKIQLHDWILKEDFIFSRFISRFSNDDIYTLFPPELAFNSFLGDLDKKPEGPFFAWIHLFPPHDPYLPPEPFKGMYNSSQDLRTFKSQEFLRHFPWNTPFTEEVKQNLGAFRDRYDEFIRYCDKQFEDFIVKLTGMKLLDNTVVIVSSDHGESFEHGYLLHGSNHLYEQVTRVPLIIWMPGQKVSGHIENVVEQVDIPATILDIAKIPVPSWMDGRSLLPLMKGEKFEFRPPFSMALDWNRKINNPITKGTFSTWENDYKLIHYYDPQNSKTMLFNLKKDPGELDNLVDSEPEVTRRLLKTIMDNLEKANKKIVEKG